MAGVWGGDRGVGTTGVCGVAGVWGLQGCVWGDQGVEGAGWQRCVGWRYVGVAGVWGLQGCVGVAGVWRGILEQTLVSRI